MPSAPLSPILYPLRTTWTQKPPMGTPLDWSHPLTRGLEACWLFNEGQGLTIYDATGNGHTASFKNASTATPETFAQGWETTHPPGPPGPALRFVNTIGANAGNIDSQVVIPGDAFTLEFWLMRTTGVTEGTVIRNPSSAPLNWLTTVGVGGTVAVLRYYDTFQNWTASTLPFANNTWNHIVVTRQSLTTPVGGAFGIMHFWVNGISEAILIDASASARYARLTNSVAGSAFTGALALGRIWQRALGKEEVLALQRAPFAMFARTPTLLRAVRAPHPPAQMQWRAQAVVHANRTYRVAPARVQWRAQVLRSSGTLEGAEPARMQWRVGLFHRTLTVEPARLRWSANRQQLPVGLNIRDCGEEYEAALQRTSIGGDWLISAPALGLFLSFNYEAGGGWEHRIIDISDIEISAPPGGGIASAANVTVSIAETGSGQSIVTIWEQASAVGAVTVTIDFLLAGAEQVLRIFTGSIDSITVKDAVAQILLVDDSIRKNLVIPQEIITVEKFPQADQAALTKAIPLVYGQGSVIGAAPMLFVDVPNNIYLLAAHPMQVGGKLAVYDQPNKTFLTLDTIIGIPNNGNATITLGTLNTGALQHWANGAGVLNPTQAIDGNSATLTVVPTNAPGPGYNSVIQVGDGWNFVRWGPSSPGTPLAGTLKIDLTNHRRSPGSDPTVTGTFYFRTVDALEPLTIERRLLYVSPAFNHTTSAQHNTFILSNVNIGVNEIFDILLVTRCEGQIGGANQTYEVGEVSITPLVAFSANISGTPTAIGLPINVQELRFNPVRPTLSLYSGFAVANASYAIDGNSLTTAAVRALTLDSNLDGYGELIVATDVTSALRANNTVVIDLINHRRGESSVPTVTGTFSIQTFNTTTGVLLRDNLFVTQAFRHVTNPISTSYVATAINMGATAQLAVRLVARNEGGSGAAGRLVRGGGDRHRELLSTTGG